jgi:hypothetical protein
MATIRVATRAPATRDEPLGAVAAASSGEQRAGTDGTDGTEMDHDQRDCCSPTEKAPRRRLEPSARS